jgi:flagellar motor switch protein FliM
MPPTLTPNEVDALMEALQEGRLDDLPEPQDEATAVVAAPKDVRPYDLVSRNRIVRGRMPTLDAVSGRLARRVMRTLADLGLGDIEVSADPAAPLKLGEFLSYQSFPASIHLISLQPLQGTGLVCIQPDLFYTWLDLAFGGRATEGAPLAVRRTNQDISPVEADFARTLLDAWCGDMAACWAEVHPLQPKYLRSEIAPDNLTIAPTSEVVMSTTFQIKQGQRRGRIDVALPYQSLEPIRHRLADHPTEETSEDRRRWQERLSESVRQVPLRLSAELGHFPIHLRQLNSLAPGDVIRLDRRPDQPLTLRMAEQAKGWVLPLVQGGNLALEFQAWRSHDER